MAQPFAVTCLIEREGRFLSVSRKDDHADKGFPGGKLDPGETPYEAMVRETFEETGIHVLEASYMFEDVDDAGHLVPMYRVTKYEGEPESKEQGLVEWVTPLQMTSPDCSFRSYNRALFTRLGLM